MFLFQLQKNFHYAVISLATYMSQKVNNLNEHRKSNKSANERKKMMQDRI